MSSQYRVVACRSGYPKSQVAVLSGPHSLIERVSDDQTLNGNRMIVPGHVGEPDEQVRLHTLGGDALFCPQHRLGYGG